MFLMTAQHYVLTMFLGFSLVAGCCVPTAGAYYLFWSLANELSDYSVKHRVLIGAAIVGLLELVPLSVTALGLFLGKELTWRHWTTAAAKNLTGFSELLSAVCLFGATCYGVYRLASKALAWIRPVF